MNSRIFDEEFKERLDAAGLAYEHRLIDDMVAQVVKWEGMSQQDMDRCFERLHPPTTSAFALVRPSPNPQLGPAPVG